MLASFYSYLHYRTIVLITVLLTFLIGVRLFGREIPTTRAAGVSLANRGGTGRSSRWGSRNVASGAASEWWPLGGGRH